MFGHNLEETESNLIKIATTTITWRKKGLINHISQITKAYYDRLLGYTGECLTESVLTQKKIQFKARLRLQAYARI